jgi:hypothetical protein
MEAVRSLNSHQTIQYRISEDSTQRSPCSGSLKPHTRGLSYNDLLVISLHQSASYKPVASRCLCNMFRHFFYLVGWDLTPLGPFAGPLGSYKSQYCDHTLAYCTFSPDDI